ncbi:MAG TPA: rod shape-determining protein MreC [Gammaproteobacteria bacterium]|nr:rod shape-determining protein MreC [Gammaproteobacteria bacterium]
MAVIRRRRSPQLFSSRPAGALRTFLLVAASIALMIYDHQSGGLRRMHSALSTLVYPVQAVVNVPHALLLWAEDKFAAHVALVRDNDDLRQRLGIAQAQLQQFAALEQENNRLRGLMQATARVPGRISAAEILAADLDPFRHLVVIDKGSGDGVYPGQTVLDANGIMGQVERADPFEAEVTLISDPSQAIQVEVNRTGLRTLAVGSADLEQLSLPYVTNDSDIKIGDLVVTSGLGGHYPAGYPVGTVIKFERNPAEPFATVAVHTTADLSHGHEVLLYWPPTPLPQVTLPRKEAAPAGQPANTGKKGARKKKP